MQIQHIYWVAAFLDGEGYFGYTNGPMILATSTDKDLLQRFRSFANLDSIIHKKERKNSICKTAYSIGIYGNVAIQWMMTVYPLMCQRRKDKIKEVINIWRERGTKCFRGHNLNGVNLILRKDGTKECRICVNKNIRARRSERMFVDYPNGGG